MMRISDLLLVSLKKLVYFQFVYLLGSWCGRKSGGSDGFGGDVQLGDIGVPVEIETMVVYDVTKRKHVNEKEAVTKHWVLGDTLRDVLDWNVLMLMNWWWTVRYDFNQERAVPVMLRDDSRRVRRMEWIIVSKAALRSSKMRILKEWMPEERMRSLVTLRRAFFVLWCDLKPDWNGL